MQQKSFPTYLLPLLILTCAIWYAGPGLYWRDSGEFLLSGVFLDVAHPPGFPTYGTVSNLLSLVPIGSLAWRVNVTSALLASLAVLVALLFAKALIVIEPGAQERKSISKVAERPELFFVSSLAAFLPLVFAPAFVRQALTAEVYGGYAAFLLSGLAASVVGYLNRDVRYHLLSCFLLGLGLGFHVALALMAPVLLFLAIPLLREKPRVFFLFLLFGFLGFLIFSYLPVRAGESPPLRTGDPSTISRFFELITDGRDRALRTEVISGIAGVNSGSMNTWIKITISDFQKLAAEISWIWGVFGFLGILLVVRKKPLIGISILWVLFSQLLFFHGWQPDPWIGSMLLLSVGVLLLLHEMSTRLTSLRSSLFLPLCAGALLLVSSPLSGARTASAIATMRLPEKTMLSVLEPIPYGSVFLHEQSFFLLTALREIEGVRTDLIPVYLPRVLFPYYFARERFQIGNRRYVTSQEGAAPTVQNWRNIGELLKIVNGERPFFVEPVIVLNQRLHQLARLAPALLFSLEPGKNGERNPKFSDWLARAEEAKRLSERQFRSDALSYFEARMTGAADLLFMRKETEKAMALIQKLCEKPEDHYCSEKSFLNLALYRQINSQKQK